MVTATYEDKVTIYHRTMFGYTRTEATKLQVETKPYAQYPVAYHVSFVPKGKCKMVGYVDSYAPSTLIFEGWNHPDFSNVFKLTDGGSITRHSSFAPEWDTEFTAAVNAYCAEMNPKILVDCRS